MLRAEVVNTVSVTVTRSVDSYAYGNADLEAALSRYLADDEPPERAEVPWWLLIAAGVVVSEVVS